MVHAPEMGIDNLAAFVAATLGRQGRIGEVAGGRAVAAAVPVANGYLNGAFRTDGSVPVDHFLSDVASFFAVTATPYVVWAESTDAALLEAALSAGGVPDTSDTPAMEVTAPVPVPDGLDVRAIDGPEERATFARICEDGYAMPGLAWMLDSQGCFDAPGSTWAVAAADGTDLSVACGFDDGTTGGIYYVATPPEHRGRGAATAVVAWLADRLFDAGASRVILQASDAGRPVYERMGFATPGWFRRVTFTPPA